MDREAYRSAAGHVIGMPLAVAEAWLGSNSGGPWGVASVDGEGGVLPAVVMILLHVENDVVVRTELDGETFVRS